MTAYVDGNITLDRCAELKAGADLIAYAPRPETPHIFIDGDTMIESANIEGILLANKEIRLN